MGCVGRPYVGELAHGVGLDGDVVLLELLLDLIDAGGDVLGLGRREDSSVRPEVGPMHKCGTFYCYGSY